MTAGSVTWLGSRTGWAGEDRVGEETCRAVFAEVRSRLAEPGVRLDELLPYVRERGLGFLQAVQLVHDLVGRLEVAAQLVAANDAYREPGRPAMRRPRPRQVV